MASVRCVRAIGGHGWRTEFHQLAALGLAYGGQVPDRGPLWTRGLGLAWRLRVAKVALVPTSEVGLDASTAVLDGRVGAHGFPVQLDQPFLGCAAFDLVRVFLERPRDIDVAACVLAEPEIRGGIMPPVGPASETSRAPVEIVVGWMALATPREIVQTRPAAASRGTAFADVQEESGFARRPEAVEAWGSGDQPFIACLVEVVPR
jgi:hypothetical protein